MRRTHIGGRRAAFSALALLLVILIGTTASAGAAATETQQVRGVDTDAIVFVNRQNVVYGIDLVSGLEWPITPPELTVVRADVSPDGSTLAFHSTGPNSFGDLYLIDTDGNNLRRMDLLPHKLHEVFWDSTGERVYFDINPLDSLAEPFQIASFDLATETIAYHTPEHVDARLIGARPGVLAYWELGSGGEATFVHMDPATDTVIARRSAVGPSQAKLNADGSQAIYATAGEGVLVLDLGGADPAATQLQADGVISWPRLSPDGRWAAFTHAQVLVAIEIANPSNRLELTDRASITSIINELWLPDSSGLLFATTAFGEMQVVHAPLDGNAVATGHLGLSFRAVEGSEGGASIASEPDGAVDSTPEPEPEPESAFLPAEPCELDGGPDRDCDGTIDWEDAFPDDPAETDDLDRDGIGDNADRDRDGDDHLNDADAFPDDPDEWADTDGDGIGDQREAWEHRSSLELKNRAANAGLVDADGDGRWDADIDEDDDGYHDAIDPDPTRPPAVACWTPSTTPELLPVGPEHSDYDGDGEPDSTDQDLDNDGVVTEQELEDLRWYHGDGDQDSDGIPDAEDFDLDGDGYDNGADQFPFDDREWIDFDCGGLGDNSDPDDDDDGVFDEMDAFPLSNYEWFDSDGDGIGNRLDADDDNDGTLDSEDDFPTDPNATTDTDFDGIPDSIDPDDDNDGVPDAQDAFPLDWLYSADADGDGEGDFEADPELTAIVEQALGLRDANGIPVITSRPTSARYDSGGADVPWGLIRILFVWPLIFFGLRKSRQS